MTTQEVNIHAPESTQLAVAGSGDDSQLMTISSQNKLRNLLVEFGLIALKENFWHCYEYRPKNKLNQYKLVHICPNNDWALTCLLLQFQRTEAWIKFKILKSYPELKEFFWDNKRFAKEFKLAVAKRKAKRNPCGWDKACFEDLKLLLGEVNNNE